MSAHHLLPNHYDEFSSKKYWDTFFQERKDAFEWYGEYKDLLAVVHGYLRREDRILVVGCGNSKFSADLYDDGFEEIENVDFSQPVVAEMCRTHSAVRPRMAWRVMDVTDMSGYEDGYFDAVVDKGTLDALMSEDTPEIRANGAAMLSEVGRVLRPGGRYLCVTLWQDFIGSAFLEAFAPPGGASADLASARDEWKIDLHAVAAISKPSPYLPLCVIATKQAPSASDEADGGGEGGEMARVAAWCDRTGKRLAAGVEPSVLTGEKEVIAHVRGAQQVHRRHFDLRELRPGRFEEDHLWVENAPRPSPRFTMLVVDVAWDGKAGVVPCAIVLVPRNKSRDFTFSSHEGLQQLAQSANARRVVAVRLNRGHDFSGGLEAVKFEIASSVSHYAPAYSVGMDERGMPIMTVEEGLGSEGKVVVEGNMECSGDFVVEEEEETDDEVEGRPAGVYRRLIFLKNGGVVQTEVRLLGDGEDDGLSTPAARKVSNKGGGKKNKGKGKGGKGKKSCAPVKMPKSTTTTATTEDGGGGVRVDSSYLCFEFHRCMVAGAALADFRAGGAGGRGTISNDGCGRAPTALVIGLGGGALPMALRRIYSGVKVLAVELDSEVVDVAKEHFGLNESASLKVLVQDGIAFVNNAAAAVAVIPPGDVTGPTSAPAPATLAVENAVSPPPPKAEAIASSDQMGWGEAFGPPYSAIFLDVDSKDTSVGMSCPPASFLESAFLANLKALLRGSKTAIGGGEGGAGVLAVNVAARSSKLYTGAVDSIREAYLDGEVHTLGAGEDDVNSVVLALPRRRGPAKSGAISFVAEQALLNAPIPRRAVASIVEASNLAQVVHLAQAGKGSGSWGSARQGSKGGKKRGGR